MFFIAIQRNIGMRQRLSYDRAMTRRSGKDGRTKRLPRSTTSWGWFERVYIVVVPCSLTLNVSSLCPISVRKRYGIRDAVFRIHGLRPHRKLRAKSVFVCGPQARWLARKTSAFRTRPEGESIRH
ncbi:hypothetical protein DENSPDRAFT_471127 [Dentipellis sp. KUC8613]|nr:hypothetical protein DENSPDRAFT_471127 [Dentipellis sp. KUC8613]